MPSEVNTQSSSKPCTFPWHMGDSFFLISDHSSYRNIDYLAESLTGKDNIDNIDIVVSVKRPASGKPKMHHLDLKSPSSLNKVEIADANGLKRMKSKWLWLQVMSPTRRSGSSAQIAVDLSLMVIEYLRMLTL